MVSNEMVNTGNHTVTKLIFSVFCFPMITDNKKPGYTVAFYTCKQKLMFCELVYLEFPNVIVPNKGPSHLCKWNNFNKRLGYY